MGIEPRCFKCKDNLDEFGGVLFSPPTQAVESIQDYHKIEKYHLCTDCFVLVMKFIQGIKDNPKTD